MFPRREYLVQQSPLRPFCQDGAGWVRKLLRHLDVEMRTPKETIAAKENAGLSYGTLLEDSDKLLTAAGFE